MILPTLLNKMKTQKVFIVVLNWNGFGDTLECLKSLDKLQITNYKLQIVVVDNNSSDGSVEKLRKLNFSQFELEILENNENLGFAEGNNVGMDWAIEHGADWVMILNNDTIVDRDLVVSLMKVAKKEKKVGILSPKIYFSKGFEFHKKRYQKSELGGVIWYAGGEMDWNNVYGRNRGVDEVDNGQYDEVSEIDFATGACMMISTKALKVVGGLDRRYFMYLEDVDLSLRMKKKGWQVLFVPDARLWHKVAQSSGIGSDLNDYYLTRNRIGFALKYAPLRAKVAVIREAIKLLYMGREWQKKGAWDFALGKMGKGSYK